MEEQHAGALHAGVCCQACGKPLLMNRSFPCPGCSALVYCTRSHAQLGARMGHDVEECSRMRLQMRRAQVRLLLSAPPGHHPQPYAHALGICGLLQEIMGHGLQWPPCQVCCCSAASCIYTTQHCIEHHYSAAVNIVLRRPPKTFAPGCMSKDGMLDQASCSIAAPPAQPRLVMGTTASSKD